MREAVTKEGGKALLMEAGGSAGKDSFVAKLGKDGVHLTLEQFRISMERLRQDPANTITCIQC